MVPDERANPSKPVPTQPSEPPVLEERASEDRDEGWGERVGEAGTSAEDDWYLRERPPHHG